MEESATRKKRFQLNDARNTSAFTRISSNWDHEGKSETNMEKGDDREPNLGLLRSHPNSTKSLPGGRNLSWENKGEKSARGNW